MDRLRPYDIFGVGVVGAARGLIVPYDDEDAPEGIHDVIGMEYPYAPVGNWINTGVSVSAKGYTRGMEAEGIAVQEESGNLFEDITETSRTVSVPFAEVKPAFEEIIENGTQLADIPAATGVSEQEVVALQSISTLRQYRVAFIGVRRMESGSVLEGDGRERGRFVMRVLNLCTLAADDVEEEMEKGSLAERVVAFSAFPDSEVDPDDGDWGRVLMEKAGVVGADAS